jgi:hypothetical protein
MKNKNQEKEKCLNPSCLMKSGTRGLCSSCYQSARLLIASGKTTWEKLEASGRTKPTKGICGGHAGEWLLGGD